MKIISMFLIISILTLVFPGSFLAQSNQTKQEKKIQKIKEKIQKLGIGEKAKIKVQLITNTTYQGYLKESNDDSFVVVDKSGGENLIKYSEIKKLGGVNLSTGAKIAIGAGIGAGATILFIFIYIWTHED